MSDETVFISGAGSGIGLGLAGLLRARGARIAAFDLTISDAVRDRLAAGDASACSFHEVDVRDSEALARAAAAAAAELGPPTLAINCAGIQLAKRFDELSAEGFERVVAVNLVGSRNFAAAVLPHMRPGGQLALVASLAGFVPNYGYAAYNASKFGVVGLAGALRLECRPKGIDVSLIAPPEVETPMVDEERRTGDPVALKLKAFAGTLSAERACAEILRGIDRRRAVIVPGHRGRFTRRMALVAPGLTNAIADRMVRRALAGR